MRWERGSSRIRSGQQTAKLAAAILLETGQGFILPNARQRKALVVAFAQCDYVLYGKAFDIIKVSGDVDLESTDDIRNHLDRVTIYEIKSTSKEKVTADFRGYFFSLSTAELLVAQTLGDRYRFAFVNTRTRTHVDLALREVMARARGIYPTWSIQF